MPKNVSATIRGGVLENRPFQLDHFHVHFGSEETRGSEHTIDGVAYPAEVHFVHYNTKYRDLESALMEENGLSVIGVFLKLGSVSNPELDELKFETLSSKGMKNSVGTLFLNNLLPTRRDYYTYEGSLTTPPCDENVRWIVMRHPIPITPSQLWALRRVNTGGSDDTSMADNYRPTQPLNGRKVDYYKESKDNKDGGMKWWVWLCIGLGGLVIILIPIIIIIATKCRTTKRKELKTTRAITV
ncbi:carbonic anhydrase-like [Oscarella lobularis]|uniref:carbonic anhydrase-like n=1 Tax=Oscarella lobularis TaxID=121494 RepID=UPI0033144E9B